ncbi:MAG: hypothetical protein COB02_11415 [Candidatus Cloacimonadota bacterium]|nr:MAG: hypothetical protein COB02_11415 [Candidatus Cloacimonadota bacterium]
MNGLETQEWYFQLLKEEMKHLDTSVSKLKDTFQREFFDAQDPMTDMMLLIQDDRYIRLENLDFEDKDYMLVN